MRQFLIFLLLLSTKSSYSQNNFTGNYQDYFESQLEINQDLTFKYSWNVDSSNGSTIGTWNIIEDTIILHADSFFDNLNIKKNYQVVIVDSVMLAGNVITKLVVLADSTTLLKEVIIPQYCPEKVYLCDNKLFRISFTEKLVDQIKKGIYSGRNYPTWFILKSSLYKPAHNK